MPKGEGLSDGWLRESGRSACGTVRYADCCDSGRPAASARCCSAWMRCSVEAMSCTRLCTARRYGRSSSTTAEVSRREEAEEDDEEEDERLPPLRICPAAGDGDADAAAAFSILTARQRRRVCLPVSDELLIWNTVPAPPRIYAAVYSSSIGIRIVKVKVRYTRCRTALAAAAAAAAAAPGVVAAAAAAAAAAEHSAASALSSR